MAIRRKKARVSAADRAAGARLSQLHAFLDDAREFTGVEPESVPGLRLRATASERIFLCIRGVFLFEADVDLTEREGVRQSRPPTPVDRGELAVTDGRAVFTGAKQIRQWSWPSIIGVAHAANGPWSVIDVSSRRRQFGVLYDDGTRDQIRFSIDLAVANAEGRRDELVRRLSDEVARTVSPAPTLGTISGAESAEEAPVPPGSEGAER